MNPRSTSATDGTTPKLYTELAAWWPLLSAPADYADEAAWFRNAIHDVCQGPPRTLLELGSGGGNTASHLKVHFRITLVDRAPAMLAVSRNLNPECEHVEGDMRSVRLGRLFDAVLVHDALMYLTNEHDLAETLATCFCHCRPRGVALFAPDYVRETFRPTTDHGGEDDGGRGLRYLEWLWDPNPCDSTYLADYAYLLRDANGGVRVEYDRHLLGLFARDDWLRLLGAAGFLPRVQLDSFGRDLFVALKPQP